MALGVGELWVGWEVRVREGLGYVPGAKPLCQDGSQAGNTKARPLTHLGVSHLRDWEPHCSLGNRGSGASSPGSS